MSEIEIPLKMAKLDETSDECVKLNTNRLCKHWVKRKKRYCRMTPVKENGYCGGHQPFVPVTISTDSNADSAGENRRIPCPLDSKHTIYEKNIKKHLKICNARVMDNQPEYIIKNINVDASSNGIVKLEDVTNVRLNNLTDKEYYGIIKKVNEIYEKYVDIVLDDAVGITSKSEAKECNDMGAHLAEEIQNNEIGYERRKHLQQVAALLDILHKENTLQAKTNFIEFGAGKGQLSYYLAKILESKEDTMVILIDRKSLRHKKDNKIEDRSRVQRVRADIGDLKMDKLPIHSNQPCIAISKHLCGAATDLTIRCITQAVECKTDFILIALCCHHCCDWASFVGKEFFQQHQLSHRDFIIIIKMVSWAVCGTGLSRERRKTLEEDQTETNQDNREECDTKQRLTLSEKEIIGYKCKRLIDYARLEFLRHHGYEATLKQYVSKDVTLENIVLMAKRKKSS